MEQKPTVEVKDMGDYISVRITMPNGQMFIICAGAKDIEMTMKGVSE